MSQVTHHSPAHADGHLALGQAVMRQDGGLRLGLAGGVSMWPTLRAGDDLGLEPADRGDIEVGEIVVCERSGRLIAHRVIEVEGMQDGGARLRCKGDTHLWPDAPIDQHEILGRVVSRHRAGRTAWLHKGPRRRLGRLLGGRANPLPLMLSAYRFVRRQMVGRPALANRPDSSHTLDG